MNQQLKPCALCGCTKIPVRQGNGIGDYWLECLDCGMSTKPREDGDGVKDWNRRPESGTYTPAAPAQSGEPTEPPDGDKEYWHRLYIEERECRQQWQKLALPAQPTSAADVAAQAAGFADFQSALNWVAGHQCNCCEPFVAPTFAIGHKYVKLLRKSTGDIFKATRADSAGIADLLKEGWEIAAPQPQPTSAVAMDEREAFEAWCNSIPANRSMGPWEIWQAARAASQQATKCRACNGNDGDMPCAYPEGHPNCLRNEQATATQPEQAQRALTADDADMVWPDGDGETFFHAIDDAVEHEVNNAWPVDVEPPANGELELKLQLAKRIPTATVRIFNITENGHEWEILTAAQPASGEKA